MALSCSKYGEEWQILEHLKGQSSFSFLRRVWLLIFFSEIANADREWPAKFSEKLSLLKNY